MNQTYTLLTTFCGQYGKGRNKYVCWKESINRTDIYSITYAITIGMLYCAEILQHVYLYTEQIWQSWQLLHKTENIINYVYTCKAEFVNYGDSGTFSKIIKYILKLHYQLLLTSPEQYNFPNKLKIQPHTLFCWTSDKWASWTWPLAYTYQAQKERVKNCRSKPDWQIYIIIGFTKNVCTNTRHQVTLGDYT